jgi:hypothetical protein
MARKPSSNGWKSGAENSTARHQPGVWRVWNRLLFAPHDPLPDGKIKDGTNFARVRRGNWCLSITIDVADGPAGALHEGVGIGLGLQDFATLSTGEKMANPRHFKQIEDQLGQ